MKTGIEAQGEISEVSHRGWVLVPPIGGCTDDMAHAMSRLDGYDRDRDMPTLQRWKDYWDAALAALPPSPVSEKEG